MLGANAISVKYLYLWAERLVLSKRINFAVQSFKRIGLLKKVNAPKKRNCLCFQVLD